MYLKRFKSEGEGWASAPLKRNLKLRFCLNQVRNFFRVEDPSLNWLASESGLQKSLQCLACMGSRASKAFFFFKKWSTPYYPCILGVTFDTHFKLNAYARSLVNKALPKSSRSLLVPTGVSKGKPYLSHICPLSGPFFYTCSSHLISQCLII